MRDGSPNKGEVRREKSPGPRSILNVWVVRKDCFLIGGEASKIWDVTAKEHSRMTLRFWSE